MSMKAVGGVVALMFIAGVAATSPQGDPGDTPEVAQFKVECQRGLGTDQKDLCGCVSGRVEANTKSDSEFELAGAIVRAVGETLKNYGGSTADARDSLQRKFDRISEDFHTTVSIPRKGAILSMVTSSVQACESKLARAKT